MTVRRWDDRPPAKRPRFTLAKLCALVALVLSVATAAEAGPITLAWDASPDPTVIGYVVLYGIETGIYTGTLDVGNQTSATVRGLADGQTYYFAVQAYSSAGRLSTFSNVVPGAAANQPPQLTNPGSQAGAEGALVTLALAGSDPDADPLAYTATGLPPTLSLDPATGVVSGTIAYDAAGTHDVTVTASDGAISSTAAFQWVVTDTNQPPIVVVPDLSHGVGALISYAIPATEPDGTLMTFEAADLPPGLALDPNAGLITGTLTNAGVYPVTLIVTDESVRSTTVEFQWTVLASNAPPTLEAPGNQEGSLVNPTSLQLAASDPDGNTLTYSATSLPPGLVLNAHSGAIAGQPTSSADFPVTVSVSDGLASALRTFTWTIFGNRAPTIQGLVSQSSLVNGLVDFTVQATDPEGSALTFSAVGLPSGLVLDGNSGSISGAPTQIGVQTVTIFVSDGTLSASQPFSWTILGNSAPTLQNPGNQIFEEYRSLEFTVVGSDPDGNPVTFDAAGLPPGLWIDTDTGTVSGLPTRVGTYTVTLTVSDGAASGSATSEWVIFPNPPPTIENPVPQTAVVGTPVFLPINANDPNGHPFTLTASGLPPGLALDQTLMLILGTPTTAGTYSNSQITAFDGTRFTSVSFPWTVAAGPAPFTAVQSNHTAPGGTPSSVAVPYTAPQLAGSLNVVAIGWHDATATIASVTDSRGNSYVLAVGPTVVPGVATQSIYYAANIVASAADENAVVVNFTGPATSPDVRIVEYAGVRAVTPVAGTAAAQGNGGLSDSGLLTTTNPTALLVGANLVDLGTTTGAGENFAARVQSSQGSLLEDRTVTALGSYNATAPVAPDGAWIMQLVAFRAVNTAPSLGPVSNQSHPEGAFVAVWLAGIDPDGDALTYDAFGLPDGLGINNDTGLIAGDLTFYTAGSHPVRATVSDGEVTTERLFTWTVTNVNGPPVVATIANQTNLEQASVTVPVTATDPDSDALVFTATGLPDGVAIHPTTGAINGTLAYTSAGVHTVTVTASGGTLAGSQTFTWTVINVNRPPALTALGHLSTTTQMVVSLPLAASEPDEDGDTVTYGASGLPPGLSVNPTTGLISGTPSSPGVYTVTATAADASPSPTTQSFVWTVVATPVGRVKFIQANSSAPQAPEAAVTVRYPAAQSAGQLNVVVVGWRDSTAQVQAVTDTTGNVYQLAVGPTVDAGVGTQAIYYAKNIAAATAGGNAVVVTFTAPPTLADIRVAAYAGIDPVNPVDRTATASGTGATSASGTVATTFASDVLIAANLVSPPTTSAAGPGYRFRLLSRSGGLVEDRLVTTVGSYSATANLSSSSAWIMQMVAFRAPNHAPVLTSPGNQISTEHESIWVELDGHDPDDEPLTYSISGLPVSLTVNASTGVISGTLSYVSAGPYTVTATISDGALASSRTFTWTVTDRNPALTRTTSGDFTGDGKTDLTVFRPSTGTWSILKSGMNSAMWSYQWGGSGDLPVPGDYDGDGRTDIAVFRPSTGAWYFIYSSTRSGAVVSWGGGGDVPVPGDYDGDGKTDIAVFRPSTGTWYIRGSSISATYVWGGGADIPTPGDYDGDGKADIAVFRPSTGTWYIIHSRTRIGAVVTWGGGGDLPVTGDYDGDGKTDIAVFRPSTGTWYIRGSSVSTTYVWGGGADIPTPGDYDGDGKTDIAVFRPSTGTWYIVYSSTMSGLVVTWGGNGDIPIPRRP